MMLDVKEITKALRWRLIPVRYAGKVRRSMSPRRPQAPRTELAERIRQKGYSPGPTIDQQTIESIREIYRPRAAQVKPTSGGHPFVNLFAAEDISPENPVFRFAVSPEVLDRAHDYFSGRLIFDSIQYLYSWPTEGPLLESQKWHRDFGDSTSFHCIAYVNDVLSDDDGPFGFVDRNDTAKIGKSLLIRRIDDEQFSRELGHGQHHKFLGHAGESVFVDPAKCYHYGSRCKRPRHALFVTFNTDRPYVGAIPLIRDNAERAVAAARVVRPDLNEKYLRAVFGA